MIVACGVGGAMFAAIAGFVAADRFQVGPVTVPWGLVLVLATLVAVLRALALITGSRLAPWAFGVGWLAVTYVFSTPSAGGDLVLSDSTRSVVYLFGGVIAVGVVAMLPPESLR